MRAQGIDHVSVSVSDIDRSLEFYHGLLGVPLLGRGEDDGPPLAPEMGGARSRFRYADLDIGRGQVLELLQWLVPAATGRRAPVHEPGSGHVGLRVDNLDEALHVLASAGVHAQFEPVRLEGPGWWAGARVVYIADPDGATVELVEWPSSEGRQLPG